MTTYTESPFRLLPWLATPLERLDDLAAWIEVQSQLPIEQRHWRQSNWRQLDPGRSTRCRTTFCAAGYVCERNGDLWASPPDEPDADRVLTPGGLMAAQQRAGDLLSIDLDEQDSMFRATATAEEVLAVIAAARRRVVSGVEA